MASKAHDSKADHSHSNERTRSRKAYCDERSSFDIAHPTYYRMLFSLVWKWLSETHMIEGTQKGILIVGIVQTQKHVVSHEHMPPNHMSKDMFVDDTFDMSSIKFEGVESTTLREGDYVATINSVEATTSEDKAERFKEKTPQLLFVFGADGKTIKKWYNLIAYKRHDSKELKDVLEAIGKDDKLLKSIGQTKANFAKLSLDEKIEVCFDSMQADANDPEGKVFYAIFKGNGRRLIDKERTKKALSILGRTFVLAGVAEQGEELTGDDCERLVGAEVGIRVTHNNNNQLKVEVIATDEVSDLS